MRYHLWSKISNLLLVSFLLHFYPCERLTAMKDHFCHFPLVVSRIKFYCSLDSYFESDHSHCKYTALLEKPNVRGVRLNERLMQWLLNSSAQCSEKTNVRGALLNERSMQDVSFF